MKQNNAPHWFALIFVLILQHGCTTDNNAKVASTLMIREKVIALADFLTRNQSGTVFFVEGDPNVVNAFVRTNAHIVYSVNKHDVKMNINGIRHIRTNEEGILLQFKTTRDIKEVSNYMHAYNLANETIDTIIIIQATYSSRSRDIYWGIYFMQHDNDTPLIVRKYNRHVD